MNYTLKINDKQADVIQVALELYGRIAMGQFKEILDHWLYRFDWNELGPEQRQLWETRFQLLKIELTGLDPNAYRGITQTPEYPRVGFDIYQTIRHRRSWDREPNHEHPGMYVRFDRPLKISAEPLPTITREDEPCTSTEEP